MEILVNDRKRRGLNAKWGILVVVAIGLFASAMQRDIRRVAEIPLSPLKGSLDDPFKAYARKRLALLDDRGVVISSCHRDYCGYPEMGSDKGKSAVFWIQDNQLFKIEVDGIVRVDEATIIARRDGQRLLPIFIVAIGSFLAIATSVFM